MAKKRPTRRSVTVSSSGHWFRADEMLTFIELRPFTRRWAQLGLIDSDLEALQISLVGDPKAGDVIEGTGGVRKVRFAPPRWSTGKRGALRVCYAYFEWVATIVLGIVYKKGEQDDFGDAERTALRGAVQRIEQALLNRPYRRGSSA